jgi:amidohydrolase
VNNDAKGEAQRAIFGARGTLIDLSHRIHAEPELGWAEVKSSHWIADALRTAGYAVEAPAFGLPTAFVATTGRGPLHIAICAEYDALPSIGHACGHNVIASSAVGAAIGLSGLADDLGLTVRVIGTPAEEAGDQGGKVVLLERGAFEGVHAAMMVHPSPSNVATPSMIAAASFDITYSGKAAHAASWPELGINAADALTVAQTAIGLLRQHILGTDRIHGIITKGGDAPNVVPAHTTARYMVRSLRLDGLETLRDRVLHCFEAGALATGTTMEVSGGASPYAQVEHDPDIAALFQRNAEALGRVFTTPARASGSTDMGNVSLVIPSIHPFLSIDCAPAVNHQPEFTVFAARPAADRAVIDAAVAMAWTAVDIAGDSPLSQRLMNRAQGYTDGG